MSATIIATISITISAIALVGAAIGLIFQARQLRMGVLQSLRVAHSESIRMAFDNPRIVAETEGEDDPDLVAKSAYVNWNMQHLRMSFLLRAAPPVVVQSEAERMFKAQFVRDWWESAGPVYQTEAFSRREHEVLKIVDRAFKRVTLPHEQNANLATGASSISSSEREPQLKQSSGP
jgi:Family of unknown function (DUF6082)